MSHIYFGGSRHTPQVPLSIAQAVAHFTAQGSRIHVGCQHGADQAVISCAIGQHRVSLLSVFSVAQNLTTAPAHVQTFARLHGSVTFGAGGSAAPMPARFLLRSIAAFQGCQSAHFFYPGSGSLAVARECVRAGLPVFAYGVKPPAIPSTAGAWQPFTPAFYCEAFGWQWVAPVQISLF